MARRKRKRTRGERMIAFIEQYCIVPEGSLVGQPVKLAEFQRRFILAVYDNPAGTREAHLSIAKKNSKTSTIAMLVLGHTAGPEALFNSEVVSGALSRDQAGQVYRYASKMVNMSPKLAAVCDVTPSKKTIVGLAMNVTYHALAAEARTTHGVSPVVVVLDEIGQVKGPRDDFFEALMNSQGAYDHPITFMISTQAAEDGDMFSIAIDDAANSDDPTIVSHVYQAPKGCDLMDRDAWKAANPALGLFRSLADLERLANKAVRMPSLENRFRNYNLNQRVSTVSPFISHDVWESCAGPVLPLVPGIPVYGGLDLSARTDLTCLILIQMLEDAWQIHPFFWTPEQGLLERARRDRVPYDQWVKEGYLITTKGATVDYRQVVERIGEELDDFQVDALAFDRWRIDVLQRDLDDLGVNLPMEKFGQGFASMSPALDDLEADLLNGRMRHGGHPVLRMCAANAVVVMDPAGNRKLDKHKATGRMDGMVALAMARGVVGVQAGDGGPSVYEERGVLTIDY